MPHSRARLAFTLAVVIGLLFGMTGRGHAQFVLYDDFSSGVIDPEKWEGASLEGGFNDPSEETIRVVDNGQLRLSLVSWGGTSSNSGTVQSRQGLHIRQLGTLGGSGFITGLGANVTVLGAEAQNCAANSSASQARAQLFGFFFNDGTGSPTSDVGNIGARIQLEQDNDGTNHIVANLTRCTAADCSTADVIAMPGNPITFTTAWSLNTPLKLKLVWDQVNGKFKFTITNVATLAKEAKKIIYLGTVTDAGPPTFSDTKQVRVQNLVENCTAARKRTFMDVVFDKVTVQRKP